MSKDFKSVIQEIYSVYGIRKNQEETLNTSYAQLKFKKWFRKWIVHAETSGIVN